METEGLSNMKIGTEQLRSGMMETYYEEKLKIFEIFRRKS